MQELTTVENFEYSGPVGTRTAQGDCGLHAIRKLQSSFAGATIVREGYLEKFAATRENWCDFVDEDMHYIVDAELCRADAVKGRSI